MKIIQFNARYLQVLPIFKTDVWLNNIILISGVQQSDLIFL